MPDTIDALRSNIPYPNRMGRLRYLAWLCSIYLAIQLASISAPLWIAAVLAGFFCYLIACVRRVHDLGLSGWWVLGLGLPFVSLTLLFLPGSPAANRYGPAPARVSRMELLGAAILLLLTIALLVVTYIWIVAPALARYKAG